MKKVQFGCGVLPLDGWENHDMDVDITKPLPYQNNSVNYIFGEMVLEHINPREAWCFLEECYRILVPRTGVVRMAVPDFVQNYRAMTHEWQNMATSMCHAPANTRKEAARTILFGHGHQSLWTAELLATVMTAIGFTASYHIYGESNVPELNNIEQHHKGVGLTVSLVESCSIEGHKP